MGIWMICAESFWMNLNIWNIFESFLMNNLLENSYWRSTKTFWLFNSKCPYNWIQEILFISSIDMSSWHISYICPGGTKRKCTVWGQWLFINHLRTLSNFQPFICHVIVCRFFIWMHQSEMWYFLFTIMIFHFAKV